MLAPALALGWELTARHRWGLLALVALFLGASGLVFLVSPAAARTVGDVMSILTYLAYLYLLSIFVYAENTLGAKGVGFPPRLFTLPMRTAILVAWPMLFGMAAVALLWVALSGLVLLPSHPEANMQWWPALLMAACLAWFQAVCWTFVSAPILRLIVAIIVLPSAILSIVLFLARHDIRPTLADVYLALGASIAVAYVVAVAGVARDRRGDSLGWAWLLRLALTVLPRLPERRRPFAGAPAAQAWFELRRHGWLLPVFVALFMAMLFWATMLPMGPGDVLQVVAAIIAWPVLLAFFVGFGMGKTSFWAQDLSLSSFVASRPLTSASLGYAKLRTAAISAVATWLLIVVAAPLWAVASGNVETVRRLGEMAFAGQPTWKLVLLTPVVLAALVGLTWLQLVQGLFLSLTGRRGVVNATALIGIALAAGLTTLGVWTANHPDFLDTALVILWTLGGVLALVKVIAVTWLWTQPRFWRERRSIGLVALWLAIVGCNVGVLFALMPETLVPTSLVALLMVLVLPLARLTGLHVAVAWNRHR